MTTALPPEADAHSTAPAAVPASSAAASVVFPSLEQLRQRRSSKWTQHGHDVLPMPVAELDVELAEPVKRTLLEAVERGDTGYPGRHGRHEDAFVAFAARRWGWQVDRAQVLSAPDVVVGAVEVLRSALEPGDRIVLSSPVYPPFFGWAKDIGTTYVDVPLLPDGRLDLEGLEREFAAGGRAYLLCHPQNPVGTVCSREELARLADLAVEYGVLVLADEIHAPIVFPGGPFTPYLAVSDAAARTGIALHSASKAWNIAGLKSALMMTAHPEARARLERLPDGFLWHAGHLGVLAATAAYAESEAWLDALLPILQSNHQLLRTELATHLPDVMLYPAQATYLAWMDLRGAGFGDDPAAEILRHGRLALSSGPTFGTTGSGHARINLGCAPDLIPEAVRRMVAARDALSRA